MRLRTRATALVGVLLLAAGSTEARVYMTQRQAIDRAFPPPHTVERRTLYLSEAQARRAATTAGVPVEVRVVPYYVGLLSGRPAGYAYFDTHLVRTLSETILILLSAEGRIIRIDILSFDEPEDYLPTPRWMEQFPGRSLDDDLSLNRGIRSLSGATLSARAITGAARRVLALHRLFVDPQSGSETAPRGNPGGGR
jgi:hypothetical protein